MHYTSATLIVNPLARGAGRRLPEPVRALRYLRARGLEARLELPGSALEATRAAAASAERGDDLLFVAGGDGSLRDAALGLAGSGTALAAVPAGTVNVWARETNLPRGLRAAIDSHLEGQAIRMDLGRAGPGCFLLMASVGWDARIAARVSFRLKRHVGDLAYVFAGVLMLPGLRAQRTDWTADGHERQGPLALMVVSNTRLYGGRVRFAPLARATDGLLDVVALQPRSAAEVMRLSLRLARGRLAGDPAALVEQATELEVHTPGLAVQVDGDYLGESPVTLRIDPGALLVSVPAGPLPAILA